MRDKNSLGSNLSHITCTHQKDGVKEELRLYQCCAAISGLLFGSADPLPAIAKKESFHFAVSRASFLLRMMASQFPKKFYPPGMICLFHFSTNLCFEIQLDADRLESLTVNVAHVQDVLCGFTGWSEF